ncbi:unnamed protein product [Oncorhynchus mykiss]|uniref:Uncharacterized protein n=1 Tax=Oncorhynchus mykiss TaxID=8022 RepID=A0A061ADP3_ONCMY|nr:unnamed protein product [Oncorhynchus mykiss]
MVLILDFISQEPDDQEASEDQDTSPPEDTSLYPHSSPGTTTQFQQNNHGQPYTGPAAQLMNNPQHPGPAPSTPGPEPGPRAQENWESTEEVPSTSTAPTSPKE